MEDREQPDALVVASPARQLDGNLHFNMLLRDADEFTEALAWKLAALADASTKLDDVVELAEHLAVYWRERFGEPDDFREAATALVAELQKIDKAGKVRRPATTTSAARPINSKKKRKARAAGKSARRARRRNRG